MLDYYEIFKHKNDLSRKLEIMRQISKKINVNEYLYLNHYKETVKINVYYMEKYAHLFRDAIKNFKNKNTILIINWRKIK